MEPIPIHLSPHEVDATLECNQAFAYMDSQQHLAFNSMNTLPAFRSCFSDVKRLQMSIEKLHQQDFMTQKLPHQGQQDSMPFPKQIMPRTRETLWATGSNDVASLKKKTDFHNSLNTCFDSKSNYGIGKPLGRNHSGHFNSSITNFDSCNVFQQYQSNADFHDLGKMGDSSFLFKGDSKTFTTRPISFAGGMVQLLSCMELSQESQEAIYDWDRSMGLRRSHSKTMRASARSRKKLQQMQGSVGLILRQHRAKMA